MDKYKIVLAALVIIIASGIFFLKPPAEADQVPPEKLLTEMVGNTRYLSTDQIATRIIKGDPSLLLVDIRTEDQFQELSLPGAYNLPLDSILTYTAEGILNQTDYDVVLFSNGNLKADQAWMLCRRKGFKNMYVMRGGLNGWVETILKPKHPGQTAPQTAIDLYLSRLGAQQFFKGSNAVIPVISAEPVTIQRKKKSSAVEGGC